MTDREAFLRAIRAHPDDDTPRLVFADWLEEHGDPAQAEFIRLQVELEPIRDQLDQPRVRELAERESILLATHSHDWLGPAADLVGPYPAFGPVFRRGLPEMVCLSLGTFLSCAEELFAACPTVREVCVYGVQGRGAELAACPQLGRIETLEIADWLTEEDAEALYGSEAYPSIQIVRRFDDFDWPPHGLFPLFSELGHGFVAGHIRDGSATLAVISLDTVTLVTFRDGGGVANWGSETCLAPEWTPDLLEERFGFRPGLIRVADFKNGTGLAIHRWPQDTRDYLEQPFDRPPGVSDHWWESRGGVLKRWIHEGRFVIEWDGREYTADATGKIIAG